MARKWMMSDFAEDGAEVGLTRSDFANVLMAWFSMNGKKTSVDEAATAFNTRSDVIVEIVRYDADWIFLVDRDGRLIGLDVSIDDASKVYLELEGE